ncbi:hypothetical protein F4680DRAFT_307801 [Xylaria scruposa]|nr:hypothetical protein F4680DRAFT_307801 [Xylaria scruposa]
MYIADPAHLINMKLLTSIIIASLGAVWALPTQEASEQESALFACASLVYNTAFCCSEGPLGLYVDCASPPIPPITVIDFKAQCAFANKDAYCCIRPLIGSLPVICSTP